MSNRTLNSCVGVQCNLSASVIKKGISAMVVPTLDSAILQINHYPADKF